MSNVNNGKIKAIIVSLVVILGAGLVVYLNNDKGPNFKKASKDSQYVFAAGNKVFNVEVGIKEANKPFVQFSTDENTSVKFLLLDSAENVSPPTKKGNKVTFENIMDKVDLTYETLENGIKEEIILKEKVGISEFLFTMELEASDAGGILTNFPDPVFYDKDGQYLFHFEKPFAVDADGNRTDDVTMQVKKSALDSIASLQNDSADTYQIRLNVNEEWLHSPDRSYPIVIDPTVVHNESGEFDKGQFNGAVDTASSQIESYYQELAADENTAGLWHMNEGVVNTCTGGSNDICDSSKNTYGAAFSGTAAFSGSGRIGTNSITLDGDSDYATTAEGANFSIDKFTISSWIYRNTDSGAGEVLIDNRDGDNDGWMLFINSTDNAVCSYNAIDAIASSSLDTGKWYHLSCVADNSTLTLYVDGILVSSISKTGSISEATNLRIGARSHTSAASYFPGKIDEIRISNVARTAEEIKAAANRKPYAVYTSPVIDLEREVTSWVDLSWSENGVATGDGETLANSTNLQTHWKFNETSGTTADNTEGTADRDLTLNNFVDTSGQDVGGTEPSGWTADNRRWGAGAIKTSSATTADYLSASNPASNGLDPGTGDWTIEGWVKISTVGPDTIIENNGGNGTTCSQAGYYIGVDSNGRLTTHVYDDSCFLNGVTSDTIISDGDWHHFTWVVDRDVSAVIYIDGVAENTNTGVTDDTVTIQPTGSIYVGGTNGTGDSNIVFDSLAYHAGTLTAIEVLQNYNSSNVQFQTRVGPDSSPDSGDWEAWSPTTNSSQMESFDSDSANWIIGNLGTEPESSLNISDENTIIQEGSGSLKIETAYIDTTDTNPGLVAYWNLNETNGDNAGNDIFDESANNQNGEFVGTNVAAGVVDGISGKARNFNGTDDYIDFGTDAVLDIANGTVSAWFKLDSYRTVTPQFFIAKDNSGINNGDFGLAIINSDDGTNPNEINLYIQDAGASYMVYSDNVAPLNKWTHVAATFGSGGMALYVDGVKQVDTDANTVGMENASATFFVGTRRASTDPFIGKVDEVKVSDVVRTAEEIAEEYRMGRDHYLHSTTTSIDLSDDNQVSFYVAADRPGTYLEATVGESEFANNQPDANTLGLWHFDEAANNACNADTNDDACDSSGNGYHGDETSSPPIVQGMRGKARDFDGSADYITITGEGAAFSNDNYTISAWIYRDTDSGSAEFILDNRDADNSGIRLAIDANDYILCSHNTIDAKGEAAISTGRWYHLVCTADGSNVSAFINGVLETSQTQSGSIVETADAKIGTRSFSTASSFFPGKIDEVRVDDTARTADEIRQAYEIGRRTMPITIDFAADLDSDNLIESATDLNFTVDATAYGLEEKGSKLFDGDKIIVREKIDGTEYIAQGNVTSVQTSGGNIWVSGWDSGSTFPTSGFTANASVFKWQKEYFDLSNITLSGHQDAIDELTLRITNGNEGRTVWIDDLTSEGDFLTTNTGSTIGSSTGERYVQYRAIMSSGDESVSANITDVTLDYTTYEPDLYWKLDENYGTTAYDHSPNALNGSVTNSTWAESGRCVAGTCLEFDGSGDYVSVADADKLDFVAADDFTIQGWFRHPAIASESDELVTKYESSGADGGYQIAMASDGDIEFTIADNNALPEDTATSTSADYDDSEWHHFSAVKNGTTSILLYVDGIQVGSDVSLTATGSLSNDDTFYVGVDGDGTGNDWVGFMDNIKIYRYARSAAEIKTDFVSGSAVRGVSSSYSPNDSFLSDGLVGYWKMDEASGNASDSSGAGTDLTNVSTTVFSVAKYANGAEPDGTADYFDAVDNSNLSVTGNLTLSAWIEPDDVTGSQDIIGKFDGSNESYLLAMEGGELRMYIDSSSNYETTTGTPLSANTLTHVAGVYDALAQTVQLFVNGEPEASSTTGTIPSSIGDDAGEFAIGAEDTTGGAANFFDGHIDEARVYNRAFSPKEITALYNWAPGPVGYWPMDENTGTTTTYDKSGNGNDGTLTSITESSWVKGQYGSALDFDGSSDYINITDVDDFKTENFTISYWQYYETIPGADSYPIAKADDAHFVIGIQSSATNLELSIWDSVLSEHKAGFAKTNLTAGTWEHISAVRDGAAGKTYVYLNGVLMANVSDSFTPNLGAGDMRLGKRIDSVSPFQGKLDDVRYYNYARTPSQIIEDMNAGHPVGGSPIASQAVWYKLDELNGTTTNDAADSTSTNGTITGSTWKQEVDCKINGCLDLDGSDDVITATNATEIDLNGGLASEFTFSSWIYADSDGEANVGQVFNKGVNTYLRVDNETGGNLDVEGKLDLVTTDATLNISAPITTASWNHVAMSYTDDSDDEITIWVNGVNVGSSTDGSGAPATDVANLLVGGTEPANFDGRIDEFKIYSTELTESEMKIDMNAGANAAFGGVLGTGERNQNLAVGGTGPVGYWPLDENTGTSSTADKSGNGYNGTLTSITESSWVRGKLGSALTFDGGADYFSPGSTAIINRDTSWSIAAWIKNSGTTGDSIYSEQDSGVDSVTLLFGVNTTGNAQFQLYGGSWQTNTSTATVNDNNWHHLLGTFSTTNGTALYIDGVLDSSVPGNTTVQVAAKLPHIGVFQDGVSSYTDYYDGEIDEVKIWDYELTRAQVAYDYNRGAPIGWWKMDDCTGTTVYDLSKNALGTYNGNNGTWSGSGGTNTSAGTCSSGTSTEAWNNGTTGKINYSLDFDNTDDVVTIANASELDFDEALQNGMTWATWIYANSDGEGSLGEIFDKGTDTFCRTDNESGSNMDLQCELDLVSADATLNVSAALTLNTWHHVVMAYTDDGDDEITLYVDGINVGSSSDGSGAPQTTDTNNLLIGGDSSYNFDGQIDDFRLYNYELSQTQIRTIMNNGAQTFGPETGAP